MEGQGKLVRIGQLADQTGTTTRTIRYYEQIGLIPEPERTPSGYRDYEPAAGQQLRFIQSAQAAGLSLSEIQTIIEIGSSNKSTCEHVETLLQDKIAEVDDRLRSLRAAKSELTRLLDHAQNLQPSECGDGTICHILYDPRRPVTL